MTAGIPSGSESARPKAVRAADAALGIGTERARPGACSNIIDQVIITDISIIARSVGVWMGATIDLAAVDDTMVAQVGGKAADRGRFVQAGFPVPRGIVLTVKAYDELRAQHGLTARVEEMLRGADFDREDRIKAAARGIKLLTEEGEVSAGFVHQDGRTVPSIHANITTSLDDRGVPSALEMTLMDGEGVTPEVTAEVMRSVQMPFVGRDGRSSSLMHEALARHIWRGRTGYGIAEALLRQ